MGAEVSLQDIDIAHRVLTRPESDGPKPVICKFVRRLAKGKVMEVRKQAAEVNPTSIRLSADRYFTSVGHNLATQVPNSSHRFKEFLSPNDNFGSFFFDPVSPDDIEREILSIL